MEMVIVSVGSVSICLLWSGRSKNTAHFFKCTVCLKFERIRNYDAASDCKMKSEAAFNAMDAWFSPSAAMIFARAS